MPEELDVADEIEKEETDSVVTEEDRNRTEEDKGGDDSNQEGSNQVVSQAVHYNHGHFL